MKKLIRLLPIMGLLFSATNANAGLIDVKEIVITNSIPTYLQVSEVVATEAGTGNDLALASAGATASGNGDWPGSSPNFAIDGVAPNSFPNIFHSDSPSAAEFLSIVLANVSELDSLTLYGRSDCCNSRDIFNVSIFNEAGGLLFSGTGFNATNTSAGVTIALPNTNTGVPEPGTLAIMGLGLAGLIFSRKRKTV